MSCYAHLSCEIVFPCDVTSRFPNSPTFIASLVILRSGIMIIHRSVIFVVNIGQIAAVSSIPWWGMMRDLEAGA